MLKIYNASGTFVTMIPDTDYTDLNIVSTLKDGDKQLSFTYFGKPTTILNEYYVVTETNRFTVKEVHPGDHSTQYVCKLTLEELEQKMFQVFTASNVTCAQAAALALSGTGWTISCSMTKKRSVQTLKKMPLEVLYKIADAFMCELSFDTLSKTVTFAEKLGQDRGVYLRTDLNLRSLTPTYDSYDYYTRLIPIGADGLTIEEVNDGKNYVENYSYSSKVRELIWEDTSYDDATELMTDAIGKLSDMAAPKRSYSASIIDLAKMPADDNRTDYSFLTFGLGDTIKITDEATGVMEYQRIVKITEYPDAPEKNTVELSNTVLTWEEMQARYQAAAQAWEDISNSDGTVNGVYVHGVQAGDVVGVEVTTGSGTTKTDLNTAVSTVQSSISVVTSDLQAATARIGTIETTYLQATMANLDTANINKAKIGTLFANVGLITSAQIVNGKVTGYLDAVQVDAASITTGTLTTDRLVIRGTNKSIVYALNNISGALQSQNVNTINGEILTERTINADRIVAGAITANEIAASTITANKMNINSLSAISANMGTITAGEIRVESVIGSDRYVGILRTSGGSASASGGIRMFEVIKDIGNTQTSYQSQFYAGTDGYLYARNANISGTITATSGTIGGWNILGSRLEIDRVADGGYRTGMQCLSSGQGTAFYAGCTTEAGGTIGGYSAFYVTQAGAVYCSKLTVNNENFHLNANSFEFGTFGGASSNNYYAKIDATGKFTVINSNGSSNIDGGLINTDSITVGTGQTEITIKNGNISIAKALSVGTTSSFSGKATFSGAVNIGGRTDIDERLFIGFTDYSSYYDYSYTDINMSSGQNAVISIHSQYSSAELRVTHDGASRTGSVLTSDAGNFGLYDRTNSKWVIRNDSSGNTYVPSITYFGSRIETQSIRLANGYAVSSYTAAGTSTINLMFLNSSDRLWLGSNTFSSRTARITLGAMASELYVYNSSGTQVLLSTAISDRRLKHDIKDLTGAKDLIMGLSAKSFKLNGEDKERYGFIAQDTKDLVPDNHALIEYNALSDDGECDHNDESTFEYSMDYIQLIAPMIQVIQEQERDLDRLRRENQSMKEDLSEIREILATLIEQTA